MACVHLNDKFLGPLFSFYSVSSSGDLTNPHDPGLYYTNKDAVSQLFSEEAKTYIHSITM